MRVFKPTFKGKKNATQEVKKFWIETKDHLGKIRRFAGYTDHDQTVILGKKIEKLIVHRSNSEPPDKELSQWIAGIPAQLRNQLVKIGILTPDRATIGKALSENIADYRKSLEARERSGQHINETVKAIKRIADDCGFKYWTDISAVKVESYLKQRREDKEAGISYRRSNAYLTALKMFANWMIEQGRAGESPIRRLKGLDVQLDKRHPRRALEPDETRRLLETTKAQPARFGMTGPERVLLYRLAAETGLRANELRTLKASSFDFDNCSVIVEAAYSKHRREDTIPLKPDTAALLKQFVSGKMPTVGVFNMPKAWDVVDMFRADLEASGIAYVDESGLYADFHCLRHTLVTDAANNPKIAGRVAQKLARHQSSAMTDRYAHIRLDDTRAAISNMPDLSQPGSKQAIVRAG